MKIVSIILSFLISCNFLAQEWKSIERQTKYLITPYQQYSFNPYTNDLWFVQYNKTTVLKNDGSVLEYGVNELGYLGGGYKIKFAFTQNKIYFAKYYFGLYEFNGSLPNLLFSCTDFDQLSNNKDTIYLTIPFEPYLKYINYQNYNLLYYARKIISKNNFFYKAGSNDGSLVKITGTGIDDYEYYSQIDNEYICPQFHDIKFSRLTDTLYVACKQGISFAYNYDFLDTITPNNTVNMPSANVLEMEFDHLDHLWAVFGDTNDKPFSIAMLENDTWINYFDLNNSPIYFDAPFDVNYFLQMEIDTLGNIWVCDKNNLHTLLSTTTPAWVA